MYAITAAAMNVAEDFPGGCVALARAIDKPESTLNHEVNGVGSAKLGLLTAAKMTKRSGDLRILAAFASECGQMLVPLPEALNVEGDDCMKRLSETSKEFADLCQEVCGSLTDGEINDNELKRINRNAGELIAAVHALQRAAAQRNAAAKPTMRSVA